MLRHAGVKAGAGAGGVLQAGACFCPCLLPLAASDAARCHVQAAKKAQFEELVRMEFARVMASGALSANEAAVQAVALARARAENMDVSRLSH